MRDAASDLLARLTRPDDDEYVTAAARRDRTHDGPHDRSRPSGRLGTASYAAVIAVAVALVTVSAVQTQAGQPADEQDREALLARIDAEQADVAAAEARVEQLTSEVDSLRSRSAAVDRSVAEVQTRLDQLGVVVGTDPVVGPGVQVTVDNAAGGEPEGRILDTDLQLLANGLWQAGAEAVAINGQRLTALTAIRSAGEAITVNFRSLTPPYVVSAVGNPESLPALLLETDAGQAFVDLRTNFGIGFEVEPSDELRLPGETA